MAVGYGNCDSGKVAIELPTQTPMVVQMMNALTSRVQAVRGSVGQLSERLVAVLGNGSPSAGVCPGPTATNIGCPLANELQILIGVVEEINDTLQTLTSRCEL